MKTDRELLESAAKACWPEEDEVSTRFDEREGGLLYIDGAHISAEEAKQMAALARWVAAYQDSLYAEWEKIPEAEQQRMRDNASRLYKSPARRDWVEKLRAFADWAEVSSGFRVH
jgi:hypothetical protein